MLSISRRCLRFCRLFSQVSGAGRKAYRQSLLNSSFSLTDAKEDDFLHLSTESLETLAAKEVREFPASLRTSIDQFIATGVPNQEFRKFVDEKAVSGHLEHICAIFDAHEAKAKPETLSWCLTMKAKLFFDYGKIGAARAVVAELREKKISIDASISFEKSYI